MIFFTRRNPDYMLPLPLMAGEDGKSHVSQPAARECHAWMLRLRPAALFSADVEHARLPPMRLTAVQLVPTVFISFEVKDQMWPSPTCRQQVKRLHHQNSRNEARWSLFCICCCWSGPYFPSSGNLFWCEGSYPQ